MHEALGAMTRREDSITSAGDNLRTFSVTVIREYDPKILNLIKLYGKPDRSLDGSVVINAAKVSKESVGGSPVLSALSENSSLDTETGWKLVFSRKKCASTEKDRINLSLKPYISNRTVCIPRSTEAQTSAHISSYFESGLDGKHGPPLIQGNILSDSTPQATLLQLRWFREPLGGNHWPDDVSGERRFVAHLATTSGNRVQSSIAWGTERRALI